MWTARLTTRSESGPDGSHVEKRQFQSRKLGDVIEAIQEETLGKEDRVLEIHVYRELGLEDRVLEIHVYRELGLEV
jgi:hypothetical protein